MTRAQPLCCTGQGLGRGQGAGGDLPIPCQQAMAASCVDSWGIRRGGCNICMCYCYSWGGSLKCTLCGHAPEQHILVKDDHGPFTLGLEPPASQLGYSGVCIATYYTVVYNSGMAEPQLWISSGV